ncbi:SurA N-terminal domain-containing protein [Marinicellulosiphila megalodicopiae]|uniref:SurA N-terminal domain-containing protein n=1 Tax=Marinicellulosiphila megalodicopiae TaxID=2724896 RepID=UPI003BB1727F
MEGLRQSARGTTGKIIIVIAVVAFVFLGFIAVIGNVSIGSIKVNGEKITPVELSSATNSIMTTYSQMGITEEQARQFAINELVNQKAFTTTIDALGMIASNQLVEENIQTDPEFTLDGQFNLEAFKRTVGRNYLTVEQYKGFVAKELMRTQFQQGAFATGFVLDSEAKDLYAIENQTRTYQVKTINQSDFIDQVVAPSQEKIQTYFDSNRTDFMSAEVTTVDYFSIETTDLVSDISITEDEINESYDQYVADQKAKATKTVSHILISTEERSNDEALEIANAALSKIQAGVEFSKVVAEYSEDIASNEIGGYYGEISTNSFGDADFILAGTALTEVGEVSKPTLSQFGYHVIRLDALNEFEMLSLEEKRDELVESLNNSKLEIALSAKIDDINNARFEVDTLTQLAKQYNAEVISSIKVLRNGGDEVTSATAFKNAAFSEQNRDEDLISEVIKLNENTLVLIDIVDYTPEQVKALDEVNSQIADILVKSEAKKMAEEEAGKIVEQYQSALVANLELDGFSEAKTIQRTDSSESNAIVTALFDMPKSSEQVSIKAVQDGENQTVIVLSSVENADVDTQSAEFTAFKQTLQSTDSREALQAYTASVIKKAKVSGL